MTRDSIEFHKTIDNMTTKEQLRQLEEAVNYGDMTLAEALLEAKNVGFGQASNMAYEFFVKRLNKDEEKEFSIEFIRNMITDD